MSKEEEKNKEVELPETEEVFEEDFFDEEEIDYEDGGDELKKKFKKLKDELKQVKKDREEYLNGWQKERADFANYKKQEEDRKSAVSESLRERILSRFLTVLDSFNMAFSNKEAWEKVDPSWRQGVEYIYSQMNSVFEEYGVKAIGKVDENFDPTVHEPMEMVQTDDQSKEHKVARVVQEGYLIGSDPREGGTGRVIRAAKVDLYEYKA